ncbi:MAG: MaoC family dehydratase [Pseudomonadota bacterium]
MRTFPTLKDLAAEQGNELGVSDWLVIDQERINMFADATDDHQWIHIDPERTQAELGMSTIAHGYLTLSLVVPFVQQIFSVDSVKRAINYGSNKVRFTNMVPVGSRVRGRLKLLRATLGTGNCRIISEVAVEIEGQTKPAMMAETITLFYE